MTTPEEKQEIIIIRRPSMADDGHHGGAWKIAFADFMTAMMALFLVLWLVNAANEETKKAVASYFNPVKLVDRNRSSKGIYDAQGYQEDEVIAPDSPSHTKPVDPDREDLPQSDAQFFEKPMEALDAIAQEYLSSSTDTRLQLSDNENTIEILDPFAPEQWTRPFPNAPKAQTEVSNIQELEETFIGDESSEDQLRQEEMVVENVDEDRMAANSDPEIEPDVDDQSDDTNEKLKSIGVELEAALTERLGNETLVAEQISVSERDNRVVISLSDTLTIPMFGVGSAVPSGELVLALEGIAEVLTKRSGGIQIEGHTDARPFSGPSDNWQLSSNRAQAALYMLLRGGVDKSRITQISGYAETQLAVPDDPLASTNRRIEILLDIGP